MRILYFSMIIVVAGLQTACQTQMTNAEQREHRRLADRERVWKEHLRGVELEDRQRKELLDSDELENARKLFVQARLAYQNAEHEEALVLLSIFCARYGDTDKRIGAEAHIIWGEIFMALNDPEKAVLVYEAALVGYPEMSKEHLAYLKLGEAYMATQQYGKAFRSFYLARLLYGDAVADLNVDEKMKRARQLYLEADVPEE